MLPSPRGIPKCKTRPAVWLVDSLRVVPPNVALEFQAPYDIMLRHVPSLAKAVCHEPVQLDAEDVSVDMAASRESEPRVRRQYEV